MTEKWIAILNKKLKVGALFTDLSKTFYTLDHLPLLAKLSACIFGNNSLSFIESNFQTDFQTDVRLRMSLVASTRMIFKIS